MKKSLVTMVTCQFFWFRAATFNNTFFFQNTYTMCLRGLLERLLSLKTLKISLLEIRQPQKIVERGWRGCVGRGWWTEG